MKHLKTFESYSNYEIIEEGVSTKLINKIDGLDKTDENSVKDLFLKLFGKASQQTSMSMKFWKRIKTNIEKFKVSNMLKCLEDAKADFESNGEVGYVVNEGTTLKYKAAGKIKTTSAFASGAKNKIL